MASIVVACAVEGIGRKKDPAPPNAGHLVRSAHRPLPTLDLERAPDATVSAVALTSPPNPLMDEETIR
jgi:hypothetical protein